MKFTYLHNEIKPLNYITKPFNHYYNCYFGYIKQGKESLL